MSIDHNRLLSLLAYCPETGLFRWRIKKARANAGDVAGTVAKRGYRYVRIDGRAYRASRLAWFYMTEEWPNTDVDHINMSRGDDRFQNLRLATRSQNKANSRAYKTNKLGLKGVRLRTDKNYRKPYTATITPNGRPIHLGYFRTAGEAGDAVYAASQGHFGEFARR